MTCPRAWQAAARDEGRLADGDLASFERHAASCLDCQREQRLAAEIARAVPSTLTPLEHQRARARLLARANAELTTPRSRPFVSLAVAVAVAATIGVVVHHRSAPEAVVVAKTQLPVAHEDVAMSPSSEPPIASSAIASSTPPPPRRAPVHAASAGAAFDDAFATFERGKYGSADFKFERFMRDFPTDPRTEDAAYLRAVARSRLGDRDGAAALARAYLDAYPHGLRRLEAQRLEDH